MCDKNVVDTRESFQSTKITAIWHTKSIVRNTLTLLDSGYFDELYAQGGQSDPLFFSEKLLIKQQF